MSAWPVLGPLSRAERCAVTRLALCSPIPPSPSVSTSATAEVESFLGSRWPGPLCFWAGPARPPALGLGTGAALVPAICLGCLAATIFSQHGSIPYRPSNQNVPNIPIPVPGRAGECGSPRQAMGRGVSDSPAAPAPRPGWHCGGSGGAESRGAAKERAVRQVGGDVCVCVCARAASSLKEAGAWQDREQNHWLVGHLSAEHAVLLGEGPGARAGREHTGSDDWGRAGGRTGVSLALRQEPL